MRRFAWWKWLVALAAVAALAIQWLVGWVPALAAAISAATVGVAALGRVVWWTWPVLLGALALWQGPRLGRWLRQGVTALWKGTVAMWVTAVERGLVVPVALGVLLLGGLVVASVFVLPEVVEPEAGPELRNRVRTTLLQASGGLVLVLGAIATWRQLHINREGQITDRYTRAVEQLGADTVDVQLGGIYALKRIAHDSLPDRPTIAEVLTAFVRHRAKPLPESEQGHDGPTESLQTRLPAVHAAMSVLGRMPRPDDVRLDLANVDLRGVDLRDANLTEAYLQSANLTRARLWHANLTGVRLWDANLTGVRLWRVNLTEANLRDANLTRARLWGANLTDAGLRDANLTDAGLRGANLTDADLRGANLTDADLRGANLIGAGHLKSATLSGARADSRTRWPEGFDPQTAGVVEEDT